MKFCSKNPRSSALLGADKAAAAPQAAGEANPEFTPGETYAFPNPVKNGKNPTIHVECGLADHVELKFYDISGAGIHSAVIPSAPSVINGRYVYEYTWDVSSLASGVYLCHVTALKDGRNPIKILKKVAVIK